MVASTRDIDAEMVGTAHPLKHITFCLSVPSTVAYTSVLLCALTKAYVVCFVIIFWVLDGAAGMHASKAHMTAKAEAEFDAMVLSISTDLPAAARSLRMRAGLPA